MSCGNTTTTTATKTCCVWPDPIITFTSGLAAADISGGSSEVSLNDIIHLYSENILKITTTAGTNQTLINLELDFTDLSVQQTTDFCTLVSECVAIGLDTYTKTEIDALLALKEDLLTFDTAPTALSTNPVTSGGLYTYLQDYFNYTTQDSDDITEGTTNLFMTAAERSKLAGLPAAVEWTSTATTTHLVTGTNEVGIGISTATAKLHVKGEGNTGATTTLRVVNSDDDAIISATDNQAVFLGGSALFVEPTVVSAAAPFKETVSTWRATEDILSTGVLADTVNVGLLDAALGPIILTLPTASSAHDGVTGRVITLKRKSSDISGNAVTIEGNGAETIDGALNVVLAAGDSITIISDNAEWHVI